MGLCKTQLCSAVKGAESLLPQGRWLLGQSGLGWLALFILTYLPAPGA